MLEAGLIGARFLHYTAGMALFGLALFTLYAYPSRADVQPARLSNWIAPAIFKLAIATFITAMFWLAVVIANMAGSASAVIDPDAVRSVLLDTSFGKVWAVRLLLAALLVGLTGFSYVSSQRHVPAVLVTVLSSVLLATLAGTGHTMHSEGMERVVHIAADGAHLLAAGAWFGGLFALAFVLNESGPESTAVLHRFSGMGYVAVAVLIGSGLINSWYLVGSISNLLSTPYGQLLLVKLAFFGGMLGLAFANRFWLVPALTTSHSGAEVAMAQLRRHVLCEQTLGILVILAVSVLGAIEPAIGH